MKKWSVLVIGILSAVTACVDGPLGDSSPPGGSRAKNDDISWLERRMVPDNEFKPAAIEDAVDAIVGELNQVEQVTTMKLSFIPKDLAGYFEDAVDGANDAFAELGVINTVVAPVPPDGNKDVEVQRALQLQYVQEHIADGYDGIGLASLAVELVPAIDTAVAQGMAVITFDSDEPTSQRDLYVGTINTEAGKTAGHTMLELLGDEAGTVIILGNDDPDWADGYDRTHEARKVLEDGGQTVVVQHTDWGDLDATETLLQTEMALAAPPIVGCLGVFSNSYQCASAAERAGVTDLVKIAAFDFEPQTLEYMQTGIIQVTHAQRQYYMGYLVPYLLYSVRVLGLQSTKELIEEIMLDNDRVDTGLDIVPAEDIELYNEFLLSLGVQ